MGAADNSVRIIPSLRLLKYIETNIQHLAEAPQSLKSLSGSSKIRQRRQNLSEPDDSGTISVSDVHWLRKHIQWQQYQGEAVEWLHELMEGCTIVLPGPPVYERYVRNPAKIGLGNTQYSLVCCD